MLHIQEVSSRLRKVVVMFLLYIRHAIFPDSPNRDYPREEKCNSQKFISVKLWDWLVYLERIR